MGKEKDTANSSPAEISARKTIIERSESDLFNMLHLLNGQKASAGLRLYNAEKVISDAREQTKKPLSAVKLKEAATELKEAREEHAKASRNYNNIAVKYFEAASPQKSDKWREENLYSVQLDKSLNERKLKNSTSDSEKQLLKENITRADKILGILTGKAPEKEVEATVQLESTRKIT